MEPIAVRRIPAILAVLVLALISAARPGTAAAVDPGESAVSLSDLSCIATISAPQDFGCLPNPGFPVSVRRLAFSPDGLTLYYARGGDLWTLDPETGTPSLFVDQVVYRIDQLMTAPGVVYVQGVTSNTDATEGDVYAVDAATGDTTHVVSGVTSGTVQGTAWRAGVFYQIVLGKIHRIDPSTGVREILPAPAVSGASEILATSTGELWIGESHGAGAPGRLHRIDPVSGAILTTIDHDQLRGVSTLSSNDDGEIFAGAWPALGGSGAVTRFGSAGAVVLMEGHTPNALAVRPGEATPSRPVTWGRLKTIYR